jgi:hypothetical protein
MDERAAVAETISQTIAEYYANTTSFHLNRRTVAEHAAETAVAHAATTMANADSALQSVHEARRRQKIAEDIAKHLDTEPAIAGKMRGLIEGRFEQDVRDAEHREKCLRHEANAAAAQASDARGHAETAKERWLQAVRDEGIAVRLAAAAIESSLEDSKDSEDSEGD